jgi:hypothetical protein
MLALGTTAPVASVTVPTISAVVSCAKAAEADRSTFLAALPKGYAQCCIRIGRPVERRTVLRRHLSLSEMAAEVLEKIPETK